jgi:hypothetical protein
MVDLIPNPKVLHRDQYTTTTLPLKTYLFPSGSMTTTALRWVFDIIAAVVAQQNPTSRVSCELGAYWLPALDASQAWKHFLLCSNEKQRALFTFKSMQFKLAPSALAGGPHCSRGRWMERGISNVWKKILLDIHEQRADDARIERHALKKLLEWR